MLPRAVRRLNGCSYVGPRFYFMTSLTRTRRKYFRDPLLTALCRAQFVKAAALTHFEIPAYCYMPDHVHLLVRGMNTDANLLDFARLAKQLSGYYVKRRHGIDLWGHGYHDRIVRHDEDTRRYVRYIRDNPVRAGLVENPADYPFLYVSAMWPDLAVGDSSAA
jgi:putative transposase